MARALQLSGFLYLYVLQRVLGRPRFDIVLVGAAAMVGSMAIVAAPVLCVVLICRVLDALNSLPPP